VGWLAPGETVRLCVLSSGFRVLTVGTVRALLIAVMVVGGIGFVTMLVYVLWQ
jgi:hypothetical protein